jgi:hypothetical protein
MNTLFFKYAVEIERSRSITKAAENLFMAQPNLSKAIKELEVEVGFTIFKRNSKGVVPYINAAELRYPSPEAVPKKRIYLYERYNQFDLLSGFPKTYMWVSPIPDRLLKRHELVQRKCDFMNNKYRDMLIYRKNYKFTELDRKFFDRVLEARNEVALKQYR